MFKSIQLEFLPPGHTHEDIDAVFTPIANGTTKFDAPTWTDFTGPFLKSCYHNHHNKPLVSGLPPIYDWKTFFLTGGLRDIEGITSYRSFEFTVRFYHLRMH